MCELYAKKSGKVFRTKKINLFAFLSVLHAHDCRVQTTAFVLGSLMDKLNYLQFFVK